MGILDYQVIEPSFLTYDATAPQATLPHTSPVDGVCRTPPTAGSSSPQDAISPTTSPQQFFGLFCTEVTYWLQWIPYYSSKAPPPLGAMVHDPAGSSLATAFLPRRPLRGASLAPPNPRVTRGPTSLPTQLSPLPSTALRGSSTGSILHTVRRSHRLFHQRLLRHPVAPSPIISAGIYTALSGLRK